MLLCVNTLIGTGDMQARKKVLNLVLDDIAKDVHTGVLTCMSWAARLWTLSWKSAWVGAISLLGSSLPIAHAFCRPAACMVTSKLTTGPYQLRSEEC